MLLVDRGCHQRGESCRLSGESGEAALCLQDGIIESPLAGDTGSVLGIGFPPFRGGPFRLVDTMGARTLVDSMLRFRDAHGEHFEPAQILVDHANAGTKFH